MVSPPLVLLGTIFRPSLTKPFFKRILNGVVKWTTVGAGTGGAVGWYKMKDEAETAVLDRVERLVCFMFMSTTSPKSLMLDGC